MGSADRIVRRRRATPRRRESFAFAWCRLRDVMGEGQAVSGSRPAANKLMERSLQLDRHLVDLAGELVVALLVVLGHRGCLIGADVRCLVGREVQSVGVLD